LSAIAKISIGTGAVVLSICLCCFLMTFRNLPKEPFLGVAVFGDPVSIVYIDRTTGKTSLISLPASTMVDACATYGTYPISSLWRLGEIEKKGGQVFASSLGSALGIPIRFYIGPKVLSDKPDNIREHLSRVLNVFSIFNIMTGSIETNMPIPIYLEVVRAVGDSLPTANILDLSKTFAISEKETYDGTREHTINPDGADLVFRQGQEVSRLRAENIRVSIVNTTGVLGLGQKVARMLSRGGITVIGTESEEKQFDSCEVSAGKTVISSFTVKSIASFLSCSVRTSEDTGTADVVVRLGKTEIQKY
jgi:hypothetical protein